MWDGMASMGKLSSLYPLTDQSGEGEIAAVATPGRRRGFSGRNWPKMAYAAALLPVCGAVFSYVLSMPILRRWLKEGPLLGLLISIGLPAFVYAEEKYLFDIPTKRVDKALIEFARQTRLPIFFPVADFRRKVSKPLRGEYGAQEGLAILLSDSGFEASITKTGILTVKPVEEIPYSRRALAAALTASVDTLSHARDSRIGASKTDLMAELMAELEEIQVIGVRRSLEDALEKKRESTEIIDAITAEDIGQLPDENIAEAIQRISGVQITRGADGEGETVQIRGLQANMVQINGIDVAVAAGDSRIINFQDIPSELFSGIEILKTPTADHVEGSIGGVINLLTRKPLSMPSELTAVATVKGRYSELNRKTSPSANFLLSRNWINTGVGNVGVIGAFTYQAFDTRGDRVRYDDWKVFRGQTLDSNGNEVGLDVNGDGLTDENDRFIYPQKIQSDVRLKDTEKLAMHLAGEWKLDHRWSFDADLNITRREEQTAEHFFSVESPARSNLLVDKTAPFFADRTINYLNEEGVPEPHAILYRGRLESARLVFGSRGGGVKDLNNETRTLSFAGKYKADNWDLEAKLAGSRATNDSERFEAVYRVDANGDGALNGQDDIFEFEFNQANGSEIPDVVVYNQDGSIFKPADPRHPALRYNRITLSTIDNENHKNEFRVDFTRHFDTDFITGLKLGTRLATRKFRRLSKYEVTENPSGLGPGDSEFDQCTTNVGVEKYENGASGNFIKDWTSALCTFSEAEEIFGFGSIKVDSFFRPLANDRVTEDSEAAYIRLDFMSEPLLGMTFTGNLGVRYVRTDVLSKGFANDLDTDQQVPVSLRGKAEKILPSLNVKVGLTDNMFIKLGISESVKSPRLNDLRPGTRIGVSCGGVCEGLTKAGNTVEYQAEQGNPSLEADRVTNYDLSWEWYFARGGLLGVGAFYKDWQSRVVQRVIENVELNGELMNVKQPVNEDVEFGDIYGVEFNYQQAFTFLPGFLSDTGINFNYTYTDEEENPSLLDKEGDTRHFRIRRSPNSLNLVLWYESGRFSLRTAYNWRQDWASGYLGATGLANIQVEQGILALSANYKFNQHLKLSFFGNNLTGETKDSYLKYEELPRAFQRNGQHYTLSLKYEF